MRGLIVQLGSTSPAAREAATKKLAAMGKAILPALHPLADAPDPELRARVRALIRRAERRLPPSAPPSDPRFGRQSVRVSSVNGRKTVDVNDNGFRIHIEEQHTGNASASAIKMTVTGVEEGKEVTETYEAKDADEQQKILDQLNDAERIRREVHERLKQRMEELDRRRKGLEVPRGPADAPAREGAPDNG